MLEKLAGVRNLATSVKGMRENEAKEDLQRQVLVTQFYQLLLEDAEFDPSRINQRMLLATMEELRGTTKDTND